MTSCTIAETQTVECRKFAVCRTNMNTGRLGCARAHVTWPASKCRWVGQEDWTANNERPCHVTRNSRTRCDHNAVYCTMIADKSQRSLSSRDPSAWMATTGPLILCTETTPAIIPTFIEVCSHGPIRLVGLNLKVVCLCIQRGVQALKPRLQRHLETNLMVK